MIKRLLFSGLLACFALTLTACKIPKPPPVPGPIQPPAPPGTSLLR